MTQFLIEIQKPCLWQPTNLKFRLHLTEDSHGVENEFHSWTRGLQEQALCLFVRRSYLEEQRISYALLYSFCDCAFKFFGCSLSQGHKHIYVEMLHSARKMKFTLCWSQAHSWPTSLRSVKTLFCLVLYRSSLIIASEGRLAFCWIGSSRSCSIGKAPQQV